MNIPIRWSDNTADLARNLAQGLNQIEATRAGAEKMVQALSGDRLIQSAHKMAAAIQEIGGAQKLTASEQERANAILDKAIAKYQALGKDAPAALLAVRDATVSNTAKLQEYSDKLGAMSASAKSVGMTLSAAISVPLAGAAVAALHLSGEFEATTTKLVSLAGVSKGELAGVKQHILDLAPAVGIGPNALAEAMYKISSTVADTKTALEILDIAAKGSAAGMGEAVDVAGALTAVINSYGAANITAARAGDILTQTVRDGGAEAKELAPTLANIVPIAAQLGVSFEEVGANIATVTKLGIPTAEAVTQLTSVMAGLVKENGKGKEALKAVGTSYAELRQELREKGLVALVQDLTDKFKGNEEGLFHVFGRIEAFRNIMSVTGAQAATYADELQRMKNAQGSLNDAFDQIKGTQVQTWNELVAAAQALAITFGDALAPSLKDLLQDAKPVLEWATDAAKAFKELPEPVRIAAEVIGGVGIAAGPALFFFGQLTGSLKSVIDLYLQFQKLQVGSGLASTAGTLAGMGPVGVAIALALTGAGVSVYEFNKNLAELEKRAKESQEPVKDLNGNLIYTTEQAAAAAKGAKQLVDGMTLTLGTLGAVGKAATGAGDAQHGLTEEYKAAQVALANLTAAQRADIEAGLALHKSSEEIAKSVRVSADVIDLYKERVKAASKETAGSTKLTEKQAEAWLALEQQFKGMSWDYTIDGALKLGGSVSQIAKAFDVSEALVRNHQATLKMWAETAKLEAGLVSKKLTEALQQVGVITIGFHTVMGGIETKAFAGIPPILDDIGQKFKHEVNPELERTIKLHEQHLKMLDALAAGFQQLAQIAGGSFGEIASAIGQAVSVTATIAHQIDAFNKAKVQKDKFGQGQALVGMGLQGVGGVEQIAQGGVGNAVSGGLSVGASAAGMLASTGAISGMVALSAATLGVGAAAIGAYYGIKALMSIGGPSDQELDARKKQADLVKVLTANLTDAQKAQVAQVTAATHGAATYATLAIAGRDAMLAIGASASEADKVVAGLLDTHNPAKFAAAMQEVNAALETTKEVAAGVEGIAAAAAEVHNVLPPALKASIEKLLEMKGLTEEQRQALTDLASGAQVDFAALKSDADKYGITLQQLGPKFEQADLNSKAQDLWRTFNELVDAGADYNGVLQGMKPHIEDLVSAAMTFGGTVPQQFQPWVQQLIDAGEYIDDNHDGINDLTQVKFANTPLDDGIGKLNKAIDHLATVLGGVPGQLETINRTPVEPKMIRVGFHYEVDPNWKPPAPEGASTAARGGLVTERGVKHLSVGGPIEPEFPGGPMGIDTQPIWAAIGEGIVTREGMRRIGLEGLAAINYGAPSLADLPDFRSAPSFTSFADISPAMVSSTWNSSPASSAPGEMGAGGIHIDNRGAFIADGPSFQRWLDEKVWSNYPDAMRKDVAGMRRVTKRVATT